MSPRFAIFVLILVHHHTNLQADEVALYDPGLLPGTTQTLNEQGFLNLSNNLLNREGFFSAGSGVTIVDTRDSDADFGAFITHGAITGNPLHPLAPELNPESGFTLKFVAAVEFEFHEFAPDRNGDGLPDEGGFGVLVLGNDARGVAINFFETEIWVHDDDAVESSQLFSRAEGAVGLEDLNEMREFEIAIYRGAYRFDLDGKPLFHGRVRDYRSYPGIDIGFVINPFDKANMISIGDPSQFASTLARIGKIQIQTDTGPPISRLKLGIEVKCLPGDQKLCLTWNSIPGRTYRIERCIDLVEWTLIETVVADLLVTELPLAKPSQSETYFRVVEGTGLEPAN